ncbi:Metallophosphoesterase [Balamuthia mandrillaris]
MSHDFATFREQMFFWTSLPGIVFFGLNVLVLIVIATAWDLSRKRKPREGLEPKNYEKNLPQGDEQEEEETLTERTDSASCSLSEADEGEEEEQTRIESYAETEEGEELMNPSMGEAATSTTPAFALTAEAQQRRRVMHRAVYALIHLCLWSMTLSVCFGALTSAAWDFVSEPFAIIAMCGVLWFSWILFSPTSVIILFMGSVEQEHAFQPLPQPRRRRGPRFGAIQRAPGYVKQAFRLVVNKFTGRESSTSTEAFIVNNIQDPVNENEDTELTDGIITPPKKAKLDRKRVKRLLFFYIGLASLFIFSFLTIYLTSGVCVCSHPLAFSTRFSRSFEDNLCPKQSLPCHLYLTLTHNTSHEIIVNFHTSTPLSHAKVYYDTVSHAHESANGFALYNSSVTAKSFRFHFIEEHQRYVHWAELLDLQPDTIYYFIAGGGDDIEHYTQERWFMTLPATSERDLIFGAGGDMGFESGSEDFMRLLGSHQELQFMMIGGDIAYANALATCYHRWDQWLQSWSKHTTSPQGRMLPLLVSIGNHEAGYSAPEAPYFQAYFPRERGLDTNWNHRKTFASHLLANHTIVLALDTGHVASPSSQKSWIDEQLNQNKNRPTRLATYHVPLYPSRESDDDQDTLRDNWLSLFDKHKLSIAFEHHDHLYKRTKLLRNGTASETSGTLYLGDGCLGITPRDLPSSKPWYLDQLQSTAHFFRVTVYANGTGFTAQAHNASDLIFDNISVSPPLAVVQRS